MAAGAQESFEVTENKFIHFVRECQVRDIYIYREQLKSNATRGKHFLKVEMEHLIAFDEPLVHSLRTEPETYIKIFENAVALIYQNDFYDETDPNLDPTPKF
jgi:DNA replication licensing factor MCM5